MITKLQVYTIAFLILFVGFKGYAENPQDFELWSIPVSLELTPMALIDLPDAELSKVNSYHVQLENDSNALLYSTNTSAFVAPPCDFIGQVCNDNDPTTVNDRIGADCLCKGEPIATTCEDINVTHQVNGGLIETGSVINLNETDSLELFANLSVYQVRGPGDILVSYYSCPSWDL